MNDYFVLSIEPSLELKRMKRNSTKQAWYSINRTISGIETFITNKLNIILICLSIEPSLELKHSII